MEPIVFGITGRIPSKKNSKRILRVGGRIIVASSKDYTTWQKNHVGDLMKLKYLASKNPVNVTIGFTAGDKRPFDLTNKAESVMDLMVDAGIIQDDNYNVVPSITLKYAGYKKGKWYTLVTIEDSEEDAVL